MLKSVRIIGYGVLFLEIGDITYISELTPTPIGKKALLTSQLVWGLIRAESYVHFVPPFVYKGRGFVP